MQMSMGFTYKFVVFLKKPILFDKNAILWSKKCEKVSFFQQIRQDRTYKRSKKGKNDDFD